MKLELRLIVPEDRSEVPRAVSTSLDEVRRLEALHANLGQCAGRCPWKPRELGNGLESRQRLLLPSEIEATGDQSLDTQASQRYHSASRERTRGELVREL